MEKPAPKRVLFLINSLIIGGAERVFVAQANELWKRGYDVRFAILFRNQALAERLELPADRLHVMAMRSPFDVRGISRLHSLIRTHRIDILYTTLNEANVIGRILTFFSPHLTLITREANMATIKTAKYKVLDIVLGPLSHRIVVVSRAIGDSIASYAPHLRGRSFVLYNGVRFPEFDPASRTGGGVKLLTVGALTPKKDIRILVRALALLPKNYSLTIVGDGGDRTMLEALARELKVADRTTFLGWVQPDAVADSYRTHDIFVLPSQFEGCPNVVSEAQSFALPVVAFDIAGMREFTDDTSGALANERTPEALAQAIASVGSSRESMRQKGEVGLRKVRGSRAYETQLEKFIALLR